MKFNLKKMVMMVCMATFLTVSLSAIAQDDKSQAKTPEEKAKVMTEKMKSKLALNDEQAAKVETANFDFISKKFALKQADDKTGLDDKMKGLQDEYNAAMKGILNEEQFKKFTEMESKGKNKDKS